MTKYYQLGVKVGTAIAFGEPILKTDKLPELEGNQVWVKAGGLYPWKQYQIPVSQRLGDSDDGEYLEDGILCEAVLVGKRDEKKTGVWELYPRVPIYIINRRAII